MIKFSFVFFVLFICMTCSGCYPYEYPKVEVPLQTSILSTPTLLLFMETRPIFISDIYPLEASSITLREYESAKSYNSQICITINVVSIAEPNDKLFPDVVIQRGHLNIDDITQEKLVLDANSSLTIIELEQGDAWVSGPYKFCWNVKLGLGRHEATFEYQLSSGSILSYSWYFSVVP